MKKVLFVGDNHIDDKQPENRSDNYLEATLNKLKECLTIAEEEKFDAIVFLGDIFDRREVGPLARNGTMKILLNQDSGKPWSFPKYVVVGNHDIQSSHPLENSSLGTLIHCGALIKTDYEPQLGIAFAHFHNDLDKEITNGFLTTNSAIIWACHASIYNESTSYDSSVIVFDTLPLHPNNSIVISGHIHKPMEVLREDGKIFVNPGCIGRRSANKDNFDRDLKVFALEYELDGKLLKKEYIHLLSAKNHTEVFKLDEIIEKKTQVKEAQEFIKHVSDIQAKNWINKTIEDKIQILTSYGEEKNIIKPVIDVAIDALNFVNMEKN